MNYEIKDKEMDVLQAGGLLLARRSRLRRAGETLKEQKKQIDEDYQRRNNMK